MGDFQILKGLHNCTFVWQEGNFLHKQIYIADRLLHQLMTVKLNSIKYVCPCEICACSTSSNVVEPVYPHVQSILLFNWSWKMFSLGFKWYSGTLAQNWVQIGCTNQEISLCNNHSIYQQEWKPSDHRGEPQ